MNLYAWFFLFSFPLLFFLFYLRTGARKKYSQKSWVERLETIARDNHTLWMTQVLYPQKEQICKELIHLEQQQRQKGDLLKISENGDWTSAEDLIQYPYIKRLFKKLIPQVTAYSRTLGLDPKYLTLSARVQIKREGTDFLIPSSSDALFSGCYFLNGDLNASKEGGVSFYKKDELSSILARCLPHSGSLILYPSDMKQKAHPNEGIQMALYFNVHFGNRKKTWFISKIAEAEKAEVKDPFYEGQAELNTPYKRENKTLTTYLLHISKLKNKLFKSKKE